MAAVTVAFSFKQRFRFPAADVYRWATDYTPHDIGLLGKQGRRGIARLNDDTLVLTDTFVSPDGKKVTKKKLVRLYPARLRWINTHITGPNLHSQFVYELFDDGPRGSYLLFTGRQIVQRDSITPKELKALTRTIKAEDSGMWKSLAKSIKADLGAAKRTGKKKSKKKSKK